MFDSGSLTTCCARRCHNGASAADKTDFAAPSIVTRNIGFRSDDMVAVRQLSQYLRRFHKMTADGKQRQNN